MNSDDQNDFEIIPPDSGLPFTKYVQHVHALLLSKTESPDSQMGGEQTLMNYLRSKDVKSLKSFLRKNSWGPSHPIRGFLWVKACEHLHKAKGNVYEEFEKELHVQRHSNDLELPAFVDFDNLTSYHLTENGVNTVGRILSIIHHTNPDIIYCPVLFPLIALFLHYMEPSDVYNCAYELLRAKQPFIMQTKVAVEASKAVLKDLTKKFAKSAYVYLVRKCDSIDVVFDRWIWWIFADLPFPYLVRVLDCYLLEGHKILYRVAIAILILFTKYSTKNVTGSNPHRNVAESIRHFCSDMPFSVKKLMKKCFGIRSLTRKEIRKLQVKHEMLLKSRNFLNHEMVKSMSNQSMGMQLTKSFSGPITLNSDSSIIKTDMLYTIWSWLPARYAVCQPELLYTSEEHGTSLMTLYSLTENHQPTLIFIKTTDDEVFGAFCSTFWGERRRSTKNVSYFGTGETFLFTLAPQKRKYEWVGLTREDVPNTANMFMAGDSSILTVGGGNGEAIQLDANLLHCRTEHCDTFDNDPLCSTEDFTCKVVEVYGFH
ncbi:hypothetical protein FSP39_007929 [Pinctada imbricata]|uniref:TBC1 domain family member 24 n=1 Tax=Pinctada imbricata TaxID=66713 RepID=A0AA89C0T6_PINIB|nr:hypothetical protein FSP39_007929 [Pinctada imbricata]